MSKNRIIPFGYMMKDGMIYPDPIESQTVTEIFDMYIDGDSLLSIAEYMIASGIPYSSGSSKWNKNMVKRIIENKKYIGDKNFPQIIDEETFIKANNKKKSKCSYCELSKDFQEIHSLVYCKECGHRLSRTGNNWTCRNPECSGFGYKLTDEMLLTVIMTVLNMVIANTDLISTDIPVSEYIPTLEVTRQQNEVNRLIDDPGVDFDKAKEEIFRLAELKYNCCTYSDRPLKTVRLKTLLSDCEKQNTLNIDLLKLSVSRILVSHFYTIEVEFTNGVTIKNITERNDENGSAECDRNTGESADNR